MIQQLTHHPQSDKEAFFCYTQKPRWKLTSRDSIKQATLCRRQAFTGLFTARIVCPTKLWYWKGSNFHDAKSALTLYVSNSHTLIRLCTARHATTSSNCR